MACVARSSSPSKLGRSSAFYSHMKLYADQSIDSAGVIIPYEKIPGGASGVSLFYYRSGEEGEDTPAEEVEE